MPIANEIDEVCAALAGWRHWVGNDMLDRLGVPAVKDVKGRDERFRRRLELADKRAFTRMLMFFELGPFKQSHQIWSEPGLKLFISHVAVAKERLAPLTQNSQELWHLIFLGP